MNELTNIEIGPKIPIVPNTSLGLTCLASHPPNTMKKHLDMLQMGETYWAKESF